MKNIFKIIVNVGYSIIFYSMIFVVSTIAVGTSLKGKPQYLKIDTNKTSMDIESYIKDYVDDYTIETRNNTTYVYTTSSLSKEKLIALYTKIYLNKEKNHYNIHLINEYTDDNSTIWATITEEGVSIS